MGTYLLDWVRVLLLVGSYVALLRHYGSGLRAFIRVTVLMGAAVAVLTLADALLMARGSIYEWGLTLVSAIAILWVWLNERGRRQPGEVS
jgi:hypothetical protein